MEVIGQDADRNCLERSTLLNQAIGVPEALDLPHQQIIAAIRDRDRKEEGAAWKFSAPILRHLSSVVESFLAGTLRFARPTSRDKPGHDEAESYARRGAPVSPVTNS
jgi:hypothetical protein